MPATRRGTCYGTFTAVYGLAWLAGSTVIGMLYGQSITAAIVFTLATQALALAALVRGGQARRAAALIDTVDVAHGRAISQPDTD